MKVKEIRCFMGPSTDMKPGYLQFAPFPEGKGMSASICCPECGIISYLIHKIIIEEDHTVTIEPSLLCLVCNAHYFVRRSKVVPA